MRYDLHVHTDYSDGSMSVEQVICCAARLGLDGLAITDHDSMGMVERAQKAAQGTGLTVLPGVELSTQDSRTGRKVHLLVYGPSRPEALTPIFTRMAEARRRSGEQMIETLCQRYPVTREEILHIARLGSTLYRVHLMRVLMEQGYAAEIYGALYHELFSEPDGSCLVPTEYTDTDAAAQAARASGGAVVLAHPGVYDSFETGERLAAQGLLDGLEFDYPRRRDEQLALHEALAARYDLIRTGGTDFHGFYSPHPHPLGNCVTGEYSLRRLHKLIEKRTIL